MPQWSLEVGIQTISYSIQLVTKVPNETKIAAADTAPESHQPHLLFHFAHIKLTQLHNVNMQEPACKTLGELHVNV